MSKFTWAPEHIVYKPTQNRPAYISDYLLRLTSFNPSAAEKKALSLRAGTFTANYAGSETKTKRNFLTGSGSKWDLICITHKLSFRAASNPFAREKKKKKKKKQWICARGWTPLINTLPDITFSAIRRFVLLAWLNGFYEGRKRRNRGDMTKARWLVQATGFMRSDYNDWSIPRGGQKIGPR